MDSRLIVNDDEALGFKVVGSARTQEQDGEAPTVAVNVSDRKRDGSGSVVVTGCGERGCFPFSISIKFISPLGMDVSSSI